jgi:outer membrane protein OmpA-like peptidoglycan-associated protein
LPIHVVGRPGYSGTHRYVKEHLLSRLGPDTGFGPQVASLEQAREVVSAVAKDPAAIGYVSLTQAEPGVRALSLGRHPAESVPPSAATVRDGSYALSRPLVLYLRPDSGPDANAFVDFALGPDGQRVLENHGFVPLPTGLASQLAETFPATAKASELIRIYFEPSSAAVARDSLSDLTAAGLATRAQRAVLVVGNADTSGNAEANRRLAQQRAEIVASRLRELGSRDARITVQVAAADHPIASNETSEGRRANRRVDVIIRSAAR